MKELIRPYKNFSIGNGIAKKMFFVYMFFFKIEHILIISAFSLVFSYYYSFSITRFLLLLLDFYDMNGETFSEYICRPSREFSQNLFRENNYSVEKLRAPTFIKANSTVNVISAIFRKHRG